MKSPVGLDVELPVMEIMRDALWGIWAQKALITRRFIPAMLLLAGLDWSGEYFFPEEDWLMQVGFMMLSVILGVVFATAIHRMALHGQYRPAGQIWKGEESRYLSRGVLIGLTFGLVFGLLFFPLTVILGVDLAAVGAVIGVSASLYVTARMSITLPEIALGGRSNFRRAWQLSEGNGSRLVLVVWIAPILLASPFLALFAVDHAVLRYLAAFGTYVTTLISLMMLSLSYQFLIDHADPEAVTEHVEIRDDTTKSSSDGFDA